jgi:hypothetical protein
MANTTYIQFFLTDVRSWIDGDVGVVHCQENILTGVGEDAADGSGGLTGGKVVATNVFRRTPMGWLASVHHASPVLAPDDTDDTGDPDDTGEADEADEAGDGFSRRPGEDQGGRGSG